MKLFNLQEYFDEYKRKEFVRFFDANKNSLPRTVIISISMIVKNAIEDLSVYHCNEVEYKDFGGEKFHLYKKKWIHSTLFSMNKDYTRLALVNYLFQRLFHSLSSHWLFLLLCYYSWHYLFRACTSFWWKHLRNVEQIERIYFLWYKICLNLLTDSRPQ